VTACDAIVHVELRDERKQVLGCLYGGPRVTDLLGASDALLEGSTVFERSATLKRDGASSGTRA
jgi:hypothetical protein